MSLLIATLLLAAAPADVASTPAVLAPVDIKEWTVPWPNTRPRDPFPDAKGGIWFVGQAGHYLARLDPKSGEFKKVALEDGAGPHNVILDAKGDVWYSGNLKGYIARMDPATEKITRYPMPDPEARDPHTLVFAKDGLLWFTVQFGSFVGRLDPKSGEVRLVKMPIKSARPYGIVLDSKGRPFFNEFGTAKIGMIDPATMELKEYPLPNPAARGRRIAITRDDRVWYVDYARGYLGRLDPKTGEVREWPCPSGEQSLPYAMTVDDRDRLWIVETAPQPNRFLGFDPKEERFFAGAPIPGGGSTVRHMVFVPKTREIWFGTDKNTIGRALVP